MTTFYCLVRKSDGYIFYVGISKKPAIRLRQHIYSNNPMGRFIKECNGEIEMIELEQREIKDWPDARIEWYFIGLFSDWGFKLFNRNCYGNKTPLHKLDIKYAFPRVTENIHNKGFILIEKYFSENTW